jgi:hypothetical protein
MKFHETNFNEYTENSEKQTLHPNIEKILNKISNNFNNLPHLIFYGADGVGKYTQSLNLIKKYSDSKLKYDKKFIINFQNKQDFSFKLSDIHFEIDMELLGCSAKLLWLQIYLQIIDIISIRKEKKCFILLKNFQNIHIELLDRLYSYMQMQLFKNYNIKFIILSTSVSFIPANILNISEVISINRPLKNVYKKCFNNTINYDICNNLKINKSDNIQHYDKYEFICNNIYEIIIHYDNINFLIFREKIYDILTYQLKVENVLWDLLNKLIKNRYIKDNNIISKILFKLDKFFLFYNLNYRPIYHIENILLYIIILIK